MGADKAAIDLRDRVRVTIGGRDITAGLRDMKVNQRINDLPDAWVEIANDELRAGNPNYRADAQIVGLKGGKETPMFTGIVHKVAPATADSTRIDFVATMIHLKEQRTGGMGMGEGSDGPGLIWSLLRASGVPEDRIDIPGAPFEKEAPFIVVAPVTGLEASERIDVATATILPDTNQFNFEGLAPPEATAEFKEAAAFAVATAQARSLFEAEQIGIAAIDLALDAISLSAEFADAVSPDGGLRSFERKATLANPRRKEITLTECLTSEDRWLREPMKNPFGGLLNSSVVGQLDLASAIGPGDPLSLAISAWNRASKSAEPLETVSALSEAIEFCLAGISMHRMFSAEERRSLTAVANAWSDEKKERIAGLVAQVNVPPLQVRLAHVLNSERIPHSEEDMDAIRAARNARNDALHGRPMHTPVPAQTRVALAFVNRLITYRLHSKMDPADE
ncbi:MAG: hypothetical protein WEA10_05480 [Actinomycetota bacterium]